MRNWMYRICVIVLAIVPSVVPAEDKLRRPNVLFLVADDLNCDLHCYGHPQIKTPNIDRLASQGTLFERAYCQFPLCSPSRSSFLTGRRPNVTRVLRNPGAPMGQTGKSPHFREALPDAVTLPQAFLNQGYFTARVGKLYHYGVPGQIGTNGLDDPPSWQEVLNPKGRDKHDEGLVKTLVPNSYGGVLSWLAADGTDEEQTDGLSARAAVQLLEQHQQGPFFLAVGFFRPHTPYVAPRKYFDLYAPENIKLPELSSDDQSRTPPPAYASAKPEQDKLTDAERKEIIQAYWASISFMDAQVGVVLDTLDRLKLTDNTIIVFTSDHGYHLHDHGLWQKQSLFERSSRVPLIISAPGQRKGSTRTASLAELVDLYPTLVDLAGIAIPQGLDGQSLKPVLVDPSVKVKRAAFTQTRRGEFDGYAVRTERFRYIAWEQGRRGEQLYDLSNDPHESRNLANVAEYADIVKEHKALLQEYSAPVPR